MKVKRIFDIVISAIALMILALPMLVVAVAVRCSLGSPVLFRQRRPGLMGRSFTLLKFRTMTEARGPDGQLLPDGQRLTRFGRLLRATSIDELPELWNVLRGEMSLVGPRPLLEEYLPLYNERQVRRHLVRPGLTGWAQVNGRNAVAWQERLELDVWYVENRTFLLDLKILWLTVRKVLMSEGIAAEGSDTMPRFRGNSV
jgi:lipopolysaccharide/colanic/teichoic acid biosynthesis glycosyltransferase